MRTFAYYKDDSDYICQTPLPFNQRQSVKHKQKKRLFENDAKYVRLDIKLDTLTDLIALNDLAVSDLRGLDRQTKNCIKKILLNKLLDYSTG